MSLIAIITRNNSRSVILSGMAAILVVTFIAGLAIGQMTIPVSEIVAILLKKFYFSSSIVNEVHESILWDIRLPRLLMTLVIGAALGVSGAALQGLFRNPLVESGLIGVSGGAALFVVALVVFGPSLSILRDSTSMFIGMPVFAFIGGLVATFLVLRISEQLGKTNIAMLILSGVAINAFTGALMGLIIFHADENQLRTFTFWTLGNLGGASWEKLYIAVPVLILSVGGLLTFQDQLNAIALGESEAMHIGVPVEKVKKSVILLSALAVGISVSLSGIIGFIGLVTPHLIRIIFRADHRLVMPASVLVGPILLIVADLLARTLAAPAELPIGVMTALIGAPFFIFLLVRTKKKNELIAK
ncbi:hemin ABC transporter permease [Cytophagales bacterium WSM2-2]|nr:hemin ABC transporter permease [Cytophagales bacterium WSM2-2]